MDDIYSIAVGLIIVSVTVLFFYYNSKKKKVNDESKNPSKEELLKARLNFFHKSHVLCNKELQKVSEESDKSNIKKSTSFSILSQSTKIVESKNKKTQVKLGADDPHLTSPSHNIETSKINPNFNSHEIEIHQDNSLVTSKGGKEKLDLIKRGKKKLINEVISGIQEIICSDC